MKVGLAAKAGEGQRVKIARSIYDYLHDKADVVVQQELEGEFGVPDADYRPLGKMDVDVLIAVGGDGTILHALMRTDCPIFGINLGQFGFLTEAEPIELPDVLDRLLDGDYQVESRLKLEATLNDERLPAAANELVIKSNRASKMLHFRIRVGGTSIMEVRADGLIVSTPTGSTGYAMSAGGPILDPTLEAFLVAPLAPFSLAARPLVLPPNRVIELQLLEPGKDAECVIDGQHEELVGPDDVVRCTASLDRARFVRFGPSFYERMWSRFGAPRPF